MKRLITIVQCITLNFTVQQDLLRYTLNNQMCIFTDGNSFRVRRSVKQKFFYRGDLQTISRISPPGNEGHAQLEGSL